MNKQKIKKQLLNNKYNWDDKTIDILSDYFYELFMTIGRVVDVENLLIRFIESDNLKNGIIHVEDELINGEFDATYNYKDLCVKIANRNMDEDYLKYIMFHELTHCVSRNVKGIGFFYNSDGLNEGVTELITSLRNRYVNYSVKNEGIYEIVTSLSFLLGKIVGFSNLFNSYFDGGEMLESLIKEKRMNYKEIIACFDFFIDKDEALFYGNFDEDFVDYTRMIVYNFFDSFGEIKDLDSFDMKMNFISLYVKSPYSLNLADEYGTYMEIIIDKQNLLNLNFQEEDIYNILKKYGLYDLEKLERYAERNNDENGINRTDN